MIDEPQQQEETLPHKIGTWVIFILLLSFIGAVIYSSIMLFKNDIPIQELNCNVTGHPEAKLSYFMNGSSQDIKCCYTMTDNYSVGHGVCEPFKLNILHSNVTTIQETKELGSHYVINYYSENISQLWIYRNWTNNYTWKNITLDGYVWCPNNTAYKSIECPCAKNTSTPCMASCFKCEGLIR